MNYAEIRQAKRDDKAADAAERRADEATRRAEDRADRQERAEQRRQAAEDRQARRDEKRRQRAAAAKSAVSWVTAHPIDLLMSVIVVVPGVLAWTAMAVYGRDIYGPVGLLFPAFSEAAMWAFAFASQVARRNLRPVWMLVTGLWVFSAVAATLNYLHGSETSVRIGLVMAIVSVSGVIAHQLHMLSDRPRRSAAERQAAKRDRLGAKRAHRMSVAAVRQAAGHVHPDGTVELLVRPGTVELKKKAVRRWRYRVEYGPVVGVGDDGPGAPPASLGEEVEQWLATGPDAGPTESGRPDASTPEHPPAASGSTAVVESDQEGPTGAGDLRRMRQEHPDRSTWEQTPTGLVLLRDAVARGALDPKTGRVVDPSSAESIRRTLGCRQSTARWLRDEWAQSE